MENKKASLKKGVYSEFTLVKKISTERQIFEYSKKMKFSSGGYRQTFLDKLGCFTEFEILDNGNYHIIEVFEYPKSKWLNKMKTGIYQFMTPLILNALVNKHDENNKITITAMSFAKMIEMVNKNYSVIKYNVPKSSDLLEIPITTVNDYFGRTDSSISYYISQCLEYLRKSGFIVVNEAHIISTYRNEIDCCDDNVVITSHENTHSASDEEMRIYSKCIAKADLRAGTKDDQNRYFGKKSGIFAHYLEEELKKYGIKYVCKGYEIYYIDLTRCQTLLYEYDWENTRGMIEGLTSSFKNSIDTNAQKRADKHTDNLNSRIYEIYDDDYLRYYMQLSTLTIPPDAESYKRLKDSAKDEYQQKNVKMEVYHEYNL